MTFISATFERLLLKDTGVKLEDLVFRQLDAENIQTQNDSSDDEGDRTSMTSQASMYDKSGKIGS